MNAFALIFADNYVKSKLGVLDDHRSAASMPIGGRFRLIDFSLSSLVNGGVSNIGIIARRNYNSLMDHVGWGKDWDLNRKNGGLKILTPLAVESDVYHYRTRFEALYNAQSYFKNMLQDYCILMEGSMVHTIDVNELLNYHIEKEADITVVYKRGIAKPEQTAIKFDDKNRVNDAMYHSTEGEEVENTLLNVCVMKKNFLKKLTNKGLTLGWSDIARDYISKNLTEVKIYAYEIEGYCKLIHTMKDYYEVNMDLRNHEIRKELFLSNYPIITRTKDSAPSYYGTDSIVKDSILADGCMIEGRVEDSVIFRNVTVQKGAVVKNSIIMQDTVIRAEAELDCVVSDKRVTVKEGVVLKGTQNCPVIISKEETV